MGMAFPIGLRLCEAGGGRKPRTRRSAIGIFYSVNLTGANSRFQLWRVFPAPEIGSRFSLIALGAITFGSGLLLLAVSELRTPARAMLGIAASLVFIAAVSQSPDPFEEFVQQRYRGQKILWQEEGGRRDSRWSSPRATAKCR